MKEVLVILLILFGSTYAKAQGTPQSQDPSGISVLKYGWTKERIGWEQDPFGGPIENFDEMRVRARNEKRVMDAKKGGSGSEVSRAERDARTDQALISSIHKNSEARYAFVYKVLLQNNNARQIKSIDWDYVFFDASNESEVGRRQFTSEGKIGPGKIKELKFFIPTPPTRTISVNALNKREREGLSEAIVIVRIDYTDGSFWQRQ
jgi:hypothetical protein